MRTAYAVLILAAIALFLAIPATGALAQSDSCTNEGDSCVINGVQGRCVSDPSCPATQAGTNQCNANICQPVPGACTAAGTSCKTPSGVSGFCAYDDTSAQLFCQAANPSPTGSSHSPSPTGSPGTTLINPLKAGTSLETLLTDILQFAIRIGVIVIVLMVVYVGFMFVTAPGEPAKITTARQALLWTIIGALVLLGAQAIAIGLQATAKALGG